MEYEVAFDGGVVGDGIEVKMHATARVEAADEDEATEAGFKKVSSLNMFFEDQQVEWEHQDTKVAEPCAICGHVECTC